MTARLSTALLSLVLPLTAAGSAGWFQDPDPLKGDGPDVLRITDDDRSLEMSLAAYLRKHDIVAKLEILGDNENDIVLKLPWGLSEHNPDIVINVDALETARDDNGRLTGQRLFIYGWFTWGITPDHAQRLAALEMLNSFETKYWSPQRTYLDKDGDLVVEASINIPDTETALPCSMVHDEIIRMVRSADRLLDLIREAGLPAPR